MKLRFYKINKEIYKATGTPRFQIFKFNPCQCGCSNDAGIGFNLGFFGFNIVTKQVM